MKKVLNHSILLVLLVSIIVTMAGCGGSAVTPTTSAAITTAGQTEAPTTAPKYFATGNEKVTLTALGISNSQASALTGGDPNNTPIAKAIEEKTGVHIEYVLTTGEDYATKFSLLVSSNDVPDMFSVPGEFPGGVDKAAKDGLIININDYLEKDAPNLKTLLDSNERWAKEAKSDDGAIYSFPMIREDRMQSVFFGPIIRKDLLDAAGLGVPETMDEWHTALTAFKKDGIETPFTMVKWYIGYCGAFTGAYGVSSYQLTEFPDGTLKYGPVMDGYKQYLTTMKQWYDEGLIDPDFLTQQDMAAVVNKMATGKSAAALGWLSDMNDFPGQATDKAWTYVATKYPVLNKGDKPIFGRVESSIMKTNSISAKCKNIDVAVKYSDWVYSKEGQIMSNFGIEGESYTLDASGNPVFTKLILDKPKNEKGWTQAQAIEMYCPVAGDSTGLQLKSTFMQLRVSSDAQKSALETWADVSQTVALPTLSFSTEEMDSIQKIADIQTYADEMTAKFILGTEPIANFDKFVEHCNNMGLNDVIKAANDSYTRFKNR